MKHKFEIGSDHQIQFYSSYDGNKTVGLIDWHKKPDGTQCGGAVLFDIPENLHIKKPAHRWQVISDGTLGGFTLSSSLQCTACPMHGWIRNGRWVNA